MDEGLTRSILVVEKEGSELPGRTIVRDEGMELIEWKNDERNGMEE